MTKKIPLFFATAWLGSLIIFGSLIGPETIYALPCTGSEHLLDIQVFGVANPVSGAQVRFYYDPQRTRLADNLRAPWTEDAEVTTNSSGSANLALAAGTYYVRIVANSFQTLDTTTIMPQDGTCSATTFYLTPVITTGEFDSSRTKLSLSPASIPADNKTTSTLTFQAFNQYGSVVPGLTVGVETTRDGLRIIAHATSTDKMGKANFSILGFMPGSAILTAKINNQIFRTITLTLTAESTTATPATSAISSVRSKTYMSGSPAAANGTAIATLNVFVKDENNQPLSGKTVTLRSALPDLKAAPEQAQTDVDGFAFFNLTSAVECSGPLTISADGVALSDRPIVTFRNTAASSAATFSLIKLADDGQASTPADSTIYFAGRDGKRHPFMNEKIYFSWYANFADVHEVSARDMSTYTLGAPVIYRPGSRLLKFTSDPKVYALETPNTLRWVKTPALAEQMYGANWAAQIHDMFDSLSYLYILGADIQSSQDYNATEQIIQASSVDDVL